MNGRCTGYDGLGHHHVDVCLRARMAIGIIPVILIQRIDIMRIPLFVIGVKVEEKKNASMMYPNLH